MGKTLFKGCQASILPCILAGVAVSALLSICLSAIISVLIMTENVEENIVSVLRFAVLGISAFAGSITGVLTAGKQYLTVSSVTSSIFAVVLIFTNLLLFDGQFHHIIWCIVTVILCGVTAGFLPAIGQRGTTKKIRKYRFG